MRPPSFDAAVLAEMPRLRRYAVALTRDRDRADDLIQNCLVLAFAKWHLWQPDTDMRAWLFTILHNHHVGGVRRGLREGIRASMQDCTVAVAPPQAVMDEVRSLDQATRDLPPWVPEILALAAQGFSYEEMRFCLGLDAVGTVRSRLGRAREMTAAAMEGAAP